MIENEVVPVYAEKYKRLAEITANLPIDALDVKDITSAVLYLVSESGRGVTGVTLPVDAGYLAGSPGRSRHANGVENGHG